MSVTQPASSRSSLVWKPWQSGAAAAVAADSRCKTTRPSDDPQQSVSTGAISTGAGATQVCPPSANVGGDTPTRAPHAWPRRRASGVRFLATLPYADAAARSLSTAPPSVSRRRAFYRVSKGRKMISSIVHVDLYHTTVRSVRQRRRPARQEMRRRKKQATTTVCR